LVRSFIDLVEAKVVPLAGDPFGQLTDGCIDVRGKIFVLPVNVIEELYERFPEIPNPDVDSSCSSTSENQETLDFSLDAPTQTDWISRKTYFLPVAELENMWDPAQDCFHDLLIQKTINQLPSTNTPRMYERVGIAAARSGADASKVAEKISLWTHPPWPAEELETFRLV
jgi:hypothetical protein